MTANYNNNEILLKLQPHFSYVQDSITKILLEYYGNEKNKFSNAIQYSLFNNGKKFRPFLLWSSGISLGVSENTCFKVGAVLEMVHTYSLIHDDLPSMDNDSQRHGKPSLHKEYSEDIAILAGDALLTDAFAFLSDNEVINDKAIAINVINNVAKYLGSKGMVLGQALEMLNTNSSRLSIDEIKHIHYLKTAKFMELAVLLGGILGSASLEVQQKLVLFGKNIGLAFQIQDDIEDFASDSDRVNICNFLPSATLKKEVKTLIKEAIEALESTDYDFSILINFAKYLGNYNS